MVHFLFQPIRSLSLSPFLSYVVSFTFRMRSNAIIIINNLNFFDFIFFDSVFVLLITSFRVYASMCLSWWYSFRIFIRSLFDSDYVDCFFSLSLFFLVVSFFILFHFMCTSFELVYMVYVFEMCVEVQYFSFDNHPNVNDWTLKYRKNEM